MSKSWKPEVRTGKDPKWYDNSVRLATKEEAEAAARDLMARWMLVVECRAVESDDPVNYKIDLQTGEMTAVKNEEVQS